MILIRNQNFSPWPPLPQQVVTPGKTKAIVPKNEPKQPRDFKDLWRKAIRQQVLLCRMERENQRILGETAHAFW